MRFLVVDDEHSICDRTTQRIRELEDIPVTEIVCAYSGEEALEKLGAESFDVLITDIHMGEMDGLELIRQAKSKVPSLMSVLVSAYDKFEYAKRGIQLGVHDFWVKPYTVKTMQTSLHGLMHQRLSNRQQKIDRIDMMLNEAILTAKKPLREIFIQNDINLPSPHLCIAACRQGCRFPDQQGELWFYQPQERAYAVLCYDDDQSLRRWLALSTEAVGESIGVSLPDAESMEMYSQAIAMLDCDWVHDHPYFYLYSPERGSEDSHSSTVKRLLKLALLPGSSEILTEAAMAEACMDDRLFAQFMVELYAGLVSELNELSMSVGHPLTAVSCEPKPNMGWREVVTRVLNEIRYIKQYCLDLSRNDPIRWAKDYVDSHIGEVVDMAVVANELNFSYQYFSKLFHEQTGMVFSKYLLEMRMKKACSLLLGGEKVAVIAEKVGYTNSNNFIRAFKKHYGVPPNSFRAV